MAPMELSVVVPAYREGEHIYENLKHLLAELEPLGLEYEVIVVSDGNTDDTVSEARRVGSDRIQVVDYAVNRGKGYALGQGVQRCRGDLVTFIDADMELNPREIRNFIEIMNSGRGYDMVIGSKRHPQSRVSYPPFRRLESLVYQLLVRILFALNVRDTQTGLKLFRRQVLRDVVPLLAVKRFAFDLELLVVARKLQYRRIAEAPIELQFQFNSTVPPWAAYGILWDTAAIFYRLHITRYYDRRRRELKAASQPPAEAVAESRLAD
ncbi:MAG TPA: glycosyltransferase [Candidatus Dormibacteraeota bacterium]